MTSTPGDHELSFRRRKIWVTCPPGFGHLGPSAALARDLAAIPGADVVIVTSPSFVETVEHVGLRGRAVGRRWLEHEVEVGFPELVGADGSIGMARVFTRAASEALPDMLRLAETERPDLVVYDWPTDYAGAAVARVLRVPNVALMTSAMVERDLFDALSAPVDELVRSTTTAGAGAATARFLTPFPPILSVEDPAVETHPIRYAATDFGADWRPEMTLRSREKPLVAVTLGTVYNRRGTLPGLVEAVAALDVRVVVAAGSAVASLSDRLPSDVTVVPWASLPQLFAAASVVVHHGGTNTTLMAALAGTPSIVIPHGADHATNAHLSETAGASVTVSLSDRSRVSDAVVRCLDDGDMRRAAHEIGEQMRGLPDAVNAMRDLLA